MLIPSYFRKLILKRDIVEPRDTRFADIGPCDAAATRPEHGQVGGRVIEQQD